MSSRASGQGEGARSYAQLASYKEWQILVPFLVYREDGAHVVECEWTSSVVARIRRDGKQWLVQVEESGVTISPAACSMTDALFDLAQHLVDTLDPGLGSPSGWWAA